MGSSREVAANLIRLPWNMLGATARLSRDVGGFALGTVIALPYRRQPRAVKLRLREPLDRANNAVRDIHDDQHHDRHKLVDLGKATIVKALVSADSNIGIPDDVTAAVAEVAVAEGIKPEEIPLVSPEEAAHANHILSVFQPDQDSSD